MTRIVKYFNFVTDKTEVIVAVGGEDDKVVLRSVETFDPNTLTWKPLACLPFAISKHGIVSAGLFFVCWYNIMNCTVICDID